MLQYISSGGVPIAKKIQKTPCRYFALRFLFASCSATLEPNSENPLQGQWKDTYGLTEYSFLDDQNLILTTYGFVDFPGTYVLNENGTIEIRYSVLGKEQINTYHFSFNGDRFFLDKNEFVREM